MQADYDQKGHNNYNWVLGPTLHNESIHNKHHVDMFKSYLKLTWRPSTANLILAICGVDKYSYIVIFAEDDSKK